MPNHDSEYITDKEILELPELHHSKIGDQYNFRYGLVYDMQTMAVTAKIEGFNTEGKNYLRVLPLPVKAADYSEQDNGLTIKTWQELSAEDFPKEEWRVHGLLPMQGLVIIAAPSGEKKTWFALELMKSMSSGSHFLAHEGFKTQQSKVLYIDAEMGPKTLQRRCKFLGLDSIPFVDPPIFITGTEINIKEDESFEALEYLVKENRIDVVIIDTLRAVAGGLQEDDAPAVREFLQRFNRFKNDGKLVIILDHCRKPDRGSHGAPKKEYVLGSQDKVANAECVLMIKGDVNPSYFTVHQVKNRTGIEMKPFNVGIRDIAKPGSFETEKVEMNYEGEFDEQTSKLDEAKLAIPQMLGSEPITTKDILALLDANNDVRSRYGREALRQLVDSGAIEKSKIGRSDAFRLKNLSLFNEPFNDG